MTKTAGFKIPIAVIAADTWSAEGTLLEHLREIATSGTPNAFGDMLKGYHPIGEWEISDVQYDTSIGEAVFFMAREYINEQ